MSALADVVYEGARSIIGPFLGHLGAGAVAVGVITGVGEASALVLRLGTGRYADRTRRPWPQTIVGYALTVLCVPLLAVAGSVPVAGVVYNGERLGKAVRTPARDTMLAHASVTMGRGYAFGLHEALDQTGALTGPALIAAALALGAGYHVAFAMLAIPGVAAILVLLRLRRVAPDPEAFDPSAGLSEKKRLRLERGMGRRFWHYAAFSAMSMLGFATWGVLAYHLTSRHVLPADVVPLLYALAMGVAALAAIGFGRIYDRTGLRGLVILPVLIAAVPWLSFARSTTAVIVGAAVWGAATGVQGSTMRAAVADLVPKHRLGAGYGTFTAVYGVAWLAGASVIGALYAESVTAAGVFVIAVQVLALAILAPLLRRRSDVVSTPG